MTTIKPRGKLARMMLTMPESDREVLLEHLADEDGWTGGEIAQVLNRAGYPATRSQVNHWRRRSRAQHLLEEAEAPRNEQ